MSGPVAPAATASISRIWLGLGRAAKSFIREESELLDGDEIARRQQGDCGAAAAGRVVLWR